LISLLIFLRCLSPALRADEGELTTARDARDLASVDELSAIIAREKHTATRNDTFDANVRLAVLNLWLCEAADVHKDEKLIKQAAQDGLSAAERAVALNQRSSEAHQLVGELLSRLIPHVFGGGMRYGKRAADEMDKAIQLDPRNADAYVSRAVSYYYTPKAFGGGKEKAFEFLQKAIDLDPRADTPHIWLAIFHLEANRPKEASTEILLARQINPKRAFTRTVADQIKGAK
jgi:tetratricopeptide (TPR) repeat protein